MPGRDGARVLRKPTGAGASPDDTAIADVGTAGDHMSRASATALRARHDDDIAHSDHVCRLATRLFIGALEAHKVRPIHLRALQTGALLHNVGLAEDPANHHVRGRDIVIGEGLRGYSDEETCMVACLVAFHRKPVEPEHEPLWRGLPGPLQGTSLRLAAILRVADGLDYTMDQTTWIARMRARRRPRVVVSGDASAAQVNVARAKKKSDLWKAVIGKPPAFAVSERGADRWDPPVSRRQTARGSAGIVLRTYLAEAIGAMPGLGTTDGIDPRHDVRVWLRRYRAALRLYRKLWTAGAYEALAGELRWVGELIGQVRDRDVNIEWLDFAMGDCPDDPREEIAGIRATEARERRKNLRELVGAFRSERFGALLAQADEWTRDAPEASDSSGGSDRPLGDEVLRVFSKSSRRIRSFEGRTDEHDTATIHALRRACRRMRYATEAWYGALGPGRRRLRTALKTVQDALGEVHDADVRMAIWPTGSDEPAAVWLHARCDAERAKAWGAFQNTWPTLLQCLKKKRLARTASGG